MKCSICGEDIELMAKGIWKGGNNAQPINNGRCCDKCDDEVVIPKRIEMLGFPKEVAKSVGELNEKLRGMGHDLQGD